MESLKYRRLLMVIEICVKCKHPWDLWRADKTCCVCGASALEATCVPWPYTARVYPA